MRAPRSAAAVACSLALSFVVAGCGKWEETPAPLTRGQVFDAVVASTAPDFDGDGLPNDVERRFGAKLGTNPDLADSDGDGLNDALEVFGPSWVYVATKGSAGALAPEAPAMPASDPTRDHAADLVDSDGDGVPDYLEFAGYRYEWSEAAFVLDAGAFHTDPLQWSTDQDAYGDGMEVSGLNMDVAVRAPGNHPLVPAYPDVVIEVTGYSIALNEQVTFGSGGQIEKGTTWSREVENGHSSGSETEVGVEAGFEIGEKTTFKFGAKLGKKWTSSDSHSETVSAGGSFSEQVNWNTARSYNPADAARLKLFVRVHNRGTAPASNLVPTINVRIGGANVATFEAASVPIFMLLPGASYPPDPGISMVVDRDGAGNPISLTDWELRALESQPHPAPLTVAVTQKRADVMRLDDGAWERVGDVNEYLARIVSVSANLFLDVGKLPGSGEQARLARRLVYAGQGPTAPRVSLASALRWTDGFEGDATAGYALQYQKDDGTTVTVFMEGTEHDDGTWRCLVDPTTMERNWPHGTTPSSLAEVLDLALLPGSEVSLRAPRPEAARLPLIHSAYAIPTEEGHEIVACASDYDAIARVVFVDKNGREVEMARDGRGPWFYSTQIAGYTFRNPQDTSTPAEMVRVESQRKTGEGDAAVPLAATQKVETVYTPTAQEPIIRRFTYDTSTDRFYARVEPGGELPEDEVDWVRLFHPLLVEAPITGYRSLKPTIFAFEDPWGWEVAPLDYMPGMRLVAHTRGGRYVSRDVKELSELTPYRDGTIWLRAGSDWDVGTDEFWTPQVDLDWAVPLLDDCGATGLRLLYPIGWVVSEDWANCVAADPRQAIHFIESNEFLSTYPEITIWDSWVTSRGGLPDLYVRSGASDETSWWLGFHAAGMVVTDLGGKTAAQYYDALGYGGVLELQADFVHGRHGSPAGTAEAYHAFDEGSVIALETVEGRIGKAYVRDWFDLDEHYDTYSIQRNVQLDYRIYQKTSDIAKPEDMTYRTPDAIYVVGRPIDPANAPIIGFGGLPEEYSLCAASGTPCLDDDPELLPDGVVFAPLTGEILGTPAASFPRTELTVYGTNDAGYASASIWITVLDPPRIAYPSPVICETGSACAVAPTVSGQADRFDITPALPAGLAWSQETGAIGGMATEVTAAAEYTVTASNRAGSTDTDTFLLETPLGAPREIAYPASAYELDVGEDVSIVPTVRGGRVALWSVAPPLPAGLQLDPDTGAVYGTPTAASAQTGYTVTAANAAGITTATLTLTVTGGSP